MRGFLLLTFLVVLCLPPALHTAPPLQKLGAATRPASRGPEDIWSNCSEQARGLFGTMHSRYGELIVWCVCVCVCVCVRAGATGDPADIVSVSIYPDPPKKGERVSLEVDLRLSKTPELEDSSLPLSLPPFPEENVTNGSVAVQLKYGIVPVFDKTWALCQFAILQHRKCPLSQGLFKVHFSTSIPGFLPHVSWDSLLLSL